jgi:UDP-N-acetylglucosamine acyltransferase
MARVHPSAIVDARAELSDDVEVGPYSVVGPRVRIGAGTRIGSHVVVDGRTTLGAGNRVYSFSSIGTEPQDKKYGGEDTELVIGDGNTIREYCLINTGTVQGGNITRIGSNNWIMGYAHVAHDCTVGSETIIANGVQLAGHVRVDDWAIIGGTSAVHQFVRVGAHTMLGGGTILLQDLPPFLMCNGNPAQTYGVHVEGLKRRNFSPDTIAALRRAYKIVYREGLGLTDARSRIQTMIGELPEEIGTALRAFVDFLAEPGRGILR